MDIIKNLLVGELGMDVFLKMLEADQTLQDSIRNLLPQDAPDNAAHDFWSIVPYESLRRNQFDYLAFLFWATNPDRRFGHYLNVFDRLRIAYLYHDPSVTCTKKYEMIHDLSLDVIKDCFDGLEVHSLVERIIDDSLLLPTKAKRIQQARQSVNALFHVEKNKRPRWIQGPEWPMGKLSPMVFEAQKRCGESVQFLFRDHDTNETRIVTQWY